MSTSGIVDDIKQDIVRRFITLRGVYMRRPHFCLLLNGERVPFTTSVADVPDASIVCADGGGCAPPPPPPLPPC